MMMVANGFAMFPDADAAGLPTGNHETRVAKLCGTGDETVEVTSMEDSVRMIARVALDPDVPDGKIASCGERVTGKGYECESQADEADVREVMDASGGTARTMIPYALYMPNRQTALSDLPNDRYPDPNLESFAEYIGRTMG